MSEIPVRFVVPAGHRAWLRVYWTGTCGGAGYHNAMVHLADGSLAFDELGGRVEDHPDERWPTACERCGAAATPDARRQVFRRTLYAPPSGGTPDVIKPGDMYYADWYPCAEGSPHCIHGWTNCDGKHLMVTLPDEHPWDTNGRASNCGSPQDKTHRCWVRHGRPELGEVVHVDKAGHTCSAGAGSISTSKYHGFLHNGRLRKC